jgi:hypothetical protein
MKIIRIISRLILGVVFIFSGFVKGIDPLGLSYKFTDYFVAFDIEILSSLALPLSFILSFLEFAIGAALLFGAFKKLSSQLVLIFMGFFAPLTLYIALTNPVTDCGCFGDALIITNWETFYKNIVLLLMAIIVFKGTIKSKQYNTTSVKTSKSMFLLTVIGYAIAVTWSLNHLPIIDFRPYKIGKNIKEGMSTPENAPQDVYRNIYFYKNTKTGKIEKFDDNNFPWQDTLNWKFDSMDDPILVSKGYTPPIHDFFMETMDGDDVADYYLENENYTFIVVAYDLEKSNKKNQERLNNLAKWSFSEGYYFTCLTSSNEGVQNSFISNTGAPYQFLTGDKITLKTIIRSNPGLLLIKNGTILEKWHYNDIPIVSEISDNIQAR